jgi:nucleoside-diphosphate-sugar epimerase
MQAGSASSDRGRVLVTGSDGFTGRHLVPELERRGYAVAVHAEEQCDLRDPAAVRRLIEAAAPDFVIHLAGISFVPHGSPAEIYAVNTVGTTNLLDALVAVRPGIRKVILASSSQVYGDSHADEIEEHSPCRPTSHYACSKLAMEHMAATYSDRVPMIITRPFNYTGPGQPEKFIVPKIVGHFARGAPSIELGNLDVVRDFSDVRQVVDVYCRLLESSVTSATLNICSGVGRSPRWLMAECARLCGYSLEVVVRSEFVRSTDATRLVGSNAQLAQAIGPLLKHDFSATLGEMLKAAGAARAG